MTDPVHASNTNRLSSKEEKFWQLQSAKTLAPVFKGMKLILYFSKVNKCQILFGFLESTFSYYFWHWCFNWAFSLSMIIFLLYKEWINWKVFNFQKQIISPNGRDHICLNLFKRHLFFSISFFFQTIYLFLLGWYKFIVQLRCNQQLIW